ncbi:MAG: NADPH:quinone oxidoreductase family protein [bacterium]|nr:NADPH:quinone oxidoreductase family protein [bacterium]
MKAVLLRKHGKPAVLQLSDQPRPEPAGGEVRVRIEHIGINYAEILSRKGLYRWAPALPYIPGMEAYGKIDAVGKNVDHRSVGERVIVGAQNGCYAEWIAIPEAQALPAIPSYTPEENAAFPVNYMTAWISLMKMARLKPRDTLLVNAAAGGVGTAAVQLARAFGCAVYGTAGSDEKVARLQMLGIDGAVNYEQENYEAEIRSLREGRGVDVVLELVGGEVYRKSLGLMEPFGRIVISGFASLDLNRWNPVSWLRAWRALPRLHLSDMGVRSYGVLATHIGYLLNDMPRLLEVWRELTTFVEEHAIRPVVGTTFSFKHIDKAHALMESRRSIGKIVITL